MILNAESRSVAAMRPSVHLECPRISAISRKNSGFHCIGQLRLQNRTANLAAQRFILEPELHFHAFVKIPGHPIRAPKVSF